MPTPSSLQVNPGSGLRLATDSYTESAVTVHNQRLGIGDAINPTYSIVAAMSTATAASHLIQIMAGASLRVRIHLIEYYLDTLATTAALGTVSLFRLTTAGTGGAALATTALDPADAASGATARQLPTTKGTEGQQLWTGNVRYIQTASASDGLVQPVLVWDFDRLRGKPVIIAAGTSNGVAIKQETAIAGAVARISVLLSESSY